MGKIFSTVGNSQHSQFGEANRSNNTGFVLYIAANWAREKAHATSKPSSVQVCIT